MIAWLHDSLIVPDMWEVETKKTFLHISENASSSEEGEEVQPTLRNQGRAITEPLARPSLPDCRRIAGSAPVTPQASLSSEAPRLPGFPDLQRGEGGTATEEEEDDAPPQPELQREVTHDHYEAAVPLSPAAAGASRTSGAHDVQPTLQREESGASTVLTHDDFDVRAAEEVQQPPTSPLAADAAGSEAASRGTGSPAAGRCAGPQVTDPPEDRQEFFMSPQLQQQHSELQQHLLPQFQPLSPQYLQQQQQQHPFQQQQQQQQHGTVVGATAVQEVCSDACACINVTRRSSGRHED